MKYKFEKVVEGLSKWIGDEVYMKMNDLQEIVARMFIGRVVTNESKIKDALVNNGIIRSFGFIDGDGMVDVDELFAELKREIERKGRLVINIPMIGKLTFVPGDVDNLYNYIVRGGYQ